MEQCFTNPEDLGPMKRKFKQLIWGNTKMQQDAIKATIRLYADEFYNGLVREEEESAALESESQTIASPDSEEPVWMNWDWGQLDVDMPTLLEEL